MAKASLKRRTCLLCGAAFDTSNSWKVYCSHRCGKVVKREKYRRWRLANPERIKELKRADRKRRRAKIREQQRAWRLRTILADIGDPVEREVRQTLFELEGWMHKHPGKWRELRYRSDEL